MDVEIKIDSALKRIKLLIMAPQMNEEVKSLQERLTQADSSFIIGCKDSSIKALDSHSITRIYTASQKVYAVCGEEEYVLKKRLYQLEAQLEACGFIRISNSEIINLKKVNNFDLSLAGTICVYFKDGTGTYVSRRYIPKIKKAIKI